MDPDIDEDSSQTTVTPEPRLTIGTVLDTLSKKSHGNGCYTE